MADTTVTGAVTSSIRPQARPTVVSGIGAKTPAKQEEKAEMSFMDRITNLFTGFGGKDPKEKPASVNTYNAKISVYQDMEDEARTSAELARQDRQGLGITRSLTGQEWTQTFGKEKALEPNVTAPFWHQGQEHPEVLTPAPVEAAAIPAQTMGEGLMARQSVRRPTSEPAEPVTEMQVYLDKFIPEIEILEGLEGDTVLGDLEPTYSYGITERKARQYRLSPDQFDTMEDFARAFAIKYREEKTKAYPDIFTTTLDFNVERGLQSFLWNAGSFYPGQLAALQSGNLTSYIDASKDIINAKDTDTTNNESRPMSGLSRRRAEEANLIGKGIAGYIPIASVETVLERGLPVFIWRDVNGNELNRFASSRPLHSDSRVGTLEVRL